MERAHRQAGGDGRRGCHSDPIFAQAACALLFLALAWLLSSARVRATGPVDHRILAADSEPGLLSAHSARPPLMLTGGGRGPYLSVVDLSAYATPQPVPHSRTTRPVSSRTRACPRAWSTLNARNTWPNTRSVTVPLTRHTWH